MTTHSSHQFRNAPSPPHPSSPIAEHLAAREIERVSTKDSEVVLFDTGQRIERRLVEESTSEVSGSTERNRYIVTLKSDPRWGLVSESSPSGGFSHLGGEKRGYPELSPLLSVLDRFETSKLKPELPAILSVPAILAGHSSLPPWALLHPVVIFQIVKESLFPFSRTHGFNLQKAYQHYSENKLTFAPEQVTPDLNQYIAGIFPDAVFSYGNSKKLTRSLEIMIFNPFLLTQTPKTDRYTPIIPSPENSVFRITHAPKAEGSVCRTYLSTSPYHEHKFYAARPITLEGIEAQRKEGFYISIDPSFLEQLARAAPLPIHESDCGANLGYPQVNEMYDQIRANSYQRSLVVDTLKEEGASLISRLNEPTNWTTISASSEGDSMHIGEPDILIRNRMVKPAKAGEMELVREATKIDFADLEVLRRILELSDSEKAEIGLHEPWRSSFSMGTE